MERTDSKERFEQEEIFHDNWASSEDFQQIDVVKMNESITAPEMRFITKSLGNISNKKLLDVGCGLGEASIYFAVKGANVISTDISGKMLELTQTLGKHYGVNVTTYKSTAEDLYLGGEKDFDIIYVGNLFHHVDIDSTLPKIGKILKPDGVMVSWDPIAYNPIINVYRAIATQVRTEDEHPLKLKDIKKFEQHFEVVECEYFWFSTLIIFIIMALVQFRSPNKVRYWKKVVEEGDKWAPIYKPLERFDRFILKVFPPFKLFCWNVVIKASKPKL